MRENSAIENPHQTVPLPAGAEASSTWADWDYECRVIWTPSVEIAGIDVEGSATQLPNGAVDGSHEPPSVWVAERQCTVAQARHLAAAITDVADRLDEWARS